MGSITIARPSLLPRELERIEECDGEPDISLDDIELFWDSLDRPTQLRHALVLGEMAGTLLQRQYRQTATLPEPQLTLSVADLKHLVPNGTVDGLGKTWRFNASHELADGVPGFSLADAAALDASWEFGGLLHLEARARYLGLSSSAPPSTARQTKLRQYIWVLANDGELERASRLANQLPDTSGYWTIAQAGLDPLPSAPSALKQVWKAVLRANDPAQLDKLAAGIIARANDPAELALCRKVAESIVPKVTLPSYAASLERLILMAKATAYGMTTADRAAIEAYLATHRDPVLAAELARALVEPQRYYVFDGYKQFYLPLSPQGRGGYAPLRRGAAELIKQLQAYIRTLDAGQRALLANVLEREVTFAVSAHDVDKEDARYELTDEGTLYYLPDGRHQPKLTAQERPKTPAISAATLEQDMAALLNARVERFIRFVEKEADEGNASFDAASLSLRFGRYSHDGVPYL